METQLYWPFASFSRHRAKRCFYCVFLFVFVLCIFPFCCSRQFPPPGGDGGKNCEEQKQEKLHRTVCTKGKGPFFYFRCNGHDIGGGGGESEEMCVTGTCIRNTKTIPAGGRYITSGGGAGRGEKEMSQALHL